MLKKAILLAAIVAAPTIASADLSEFNTGGLERNVICSNVPSNSGSVGGFFIANVGYFVQEAAAEYASVDAIVVPAQYDVKDADDVQAFLDSQGLDNYALEIKVDTIEFTTIVGGVSTTISKDEPAYRQRWCS